MKYRLNYKTTIKFLFLLMLFPYIKLQAQSFEGTMSGSMAGKDVRLFIWVDLEMPNDGKVTGSYFYKTVGKEIRISGTNNGKQIKLTEKDKNQKTTGFLVLSFFDRNLQGFWLNPDRADTLQVKLYRTNPSFRNTAKIPKLKELLAEDIEFYSSGLNSKDAEQGVNYAVLFAGSNLLSVELNWENYSYTAHYGTIHHTYDLQSREIINLRDVINDSCISYICSKLQEIVTNHREEETDSVWAESLYPYMDKPEEFLQAKEKVNGLFSVTSLPEKAEFYLDQEGLTCYIQDYCEQYFSSGNRAMTFDCLVNIPFHDLQRFIKKGSILWNLFYQ